MTTKSQGFDRLTVSICSEQMIIPMQEKRHFGTWGCLDTSSTRVCVCQVQCHDILTHNPRCFRLLTARVSGEMVLFFGSSQCYFSTQDHRSAHQFKPSSRNKYGMLQHLISTQQFKLRGDTSIRATGSLIFKTLKSSLTLLRDPFTGGPAADQDCDTTP